jgi:hypothetical protein
LRRGNNGPRENLEGSHCVPRASGLIRNDLGRIARIDAIRHQTRTKAGKSYSERARFAVIEWLLSIRQQIIV